MEGTKAIKKGEVKMRYTEITADTLLAIKTLSESPIPDRIKKEIWKRPFVKAMYILHRNGNFNSQKLMEKMINHHTKLVIYNRLADWFNHLESIYNLAARTPVKFQIKPTNKVQIDE